MKHIIFEQRGTKKLVTPLGDFGCQSFPLIEGNTYEITDEELEKLGKHELKWSTETYEEDGETKTRPILIENDPTEENAIREAHEEIAALQAYLAETDYEAIKFAEGEMSDIKYEPYRVKRKQARARINELQKMYNLE